MKWLLVAGAVIVVGLLAGLFVMMRSDDSPPVPPSPFAGSGVPSAGCVKLCDLDTRCGTTAWDGPRACTNTCLELAVLRDISSTHACADLVTEGLDCWWRATQTCAPEDSCADAWDRAYHCVCKLPNLPAAMLDRCKANGEL